ncbi:unnamed protein product [Owenia fusiformis]|uniref:Uncharacterized protein n=1 Tax=Owenia fusiformis TaxID=6347 RepID=A0A8S4NQ43_OWEFU|nr:unnamed protein product [Owenia fusiformis]
MKVSAVVIFAVFLLLLDTVTCQWSFNKGGSWGKMYARKPGGKRDGELSPGFKFQQRDTPSSMQNRINDAMLVEEIYQFIKAQQNKRGFCDDAILRNILPNVCN